MKNRIFGSTNISVSEVGLGCWQLGADCWGDLSEDRARTILHAAVESGVTFLDTADVYGSGRSEQLIGRFLQECSADIFVATKLGRGPGTYPDQYTRESLTAATESSLRNLGVDALDLTQLHCVPLEVLRDGEIFSIMNDLQKSGKIKRWGASVESIEQADACIDAPGLTSFQIIFNIFRQKPIHELFARVREKNIGIIVRLPMASGALAGKYIGDEVFAENDHRNFNANGEMFSVGETFAGIPFKKAVALADELKSFCPPEITLAQFAMRWILDFPEVSVVIPGASRVEQVEGNASASALHPLSEETHAALATFYNEQVHAHIRGVY
jgi:aryl-alcohol dehydrogenase-like predicted oxidoreductase